MFKQVLSEAPWIDAIVRGEGEEIFTEVVRAIDSGEWMTRRRAIKGLAFTEEAGEETKILATEAAPTVKNVDAITPDWGILEWSKYKYIPLNCRVAIPNMARGCPFTCTFCSQWRFWRDYRVRDPKKVVDEIELSTRSTTSASSSSRTRSRRSTARNSSSSARSSSNADCRTRCSGASTPA